MYNTWGNRPHLVPGLEKLWESITNYINSCYISNNKTSEHDV